jgi:hypothetical protein
VHVLPGAWQTIPPEHLENRRQIALEEEDKEAFKKISAIIQREHQQLLAQTELCNRKEENL